MDLLSGTLLLLNFYDAFLIISCNLGGEQNSTALAGLSRALSVPASQTHSPGRVAQIFLVCSSVVAADFTSKSSLCLN
jgi:hypothetical protein